MIDYLLTREEADKNGLISPDALPECGDVLTDGELGFHLREGSHFHIRTDWLVYMDAAEKYLRKQLNKD